MSELVVESCGPANSIQDGGRRGLQRIGLPRSGALDPVALAAANALVGNPHSAPAIELLLGGITLRALGGAARLALAGCDFPIKCGGEPIATHRSFLLSHGQQVVIGSARNGVCGILAVEGGYDVAEVLGSASLHARSQVGGLDGRNLRPGDRLPLKLDAKPGVERTMAPLATKSSPAIRVVLGPQSDHFPDAAVSLLVESAFTVTSECDRMAYRLAGPAIRPLRNTNFISDGVAEGSIQVSGSGQLIVTLADRQTIGGYPKIATVITADLPLLANCLPGEAVRFAAVSIEQAQAELRRHCRRLAAMATEMLARANDSNFSSDAAIECTAGNVVSALDMGTWG